MSHQDHHDHQTLHLDEHTKETVLNPQRACSILLCHSMRRCDGMLSRFLCDAAAGSLSVLPPAPPHANPIASNKIINHM